jgi:hypothetical protein
MVPETRIAEMRNLLVLIELAAINCFQRRQRIGSSHNSAFSALNIYLIAENAEIGTEPQRNLTNTYRF